MILGLNEVKNEYLKGKNNKQSVVVIEGKMGPENPNKYVFDLTYKVNKGPYTGQTITQRHFFTRPSNISKGNLFKLQELLRDFNMFEKKKDENGNEFIVYPDPFTPDMLIRKNCLIDTDYDKNNEKYTRVTNHYPYKENETKFESDELPEIAPKEAKDNGIVF